MKTHETSEIQREKKSFNNNAVDRFVVFGLKTYFIVGEHKLLYNVM